MKLSARDASAYFARPDPERAGLLIYGADAMRISLRRQEVIAALLGPDGEGEMRLTRLPAAELRKDADRVRIELKSVGFFSGPRVVFVEDATDQAADAVLAGLASWASGDASLIVTAGQLRANSKLRKGFETDRSAYAVGIYDDPPSRDEIERNLKDAGIVAQDSESLRMLGDLARALEPGDFRQTLEKIGLYKLGDSAPLTSDDVAACMPNSVEADLDDVLHVVAEAEAAKIGPVLQRLKAQGTNPVTLTISAMRHFRTLHAAASDPAGPAQGIARARPPVYGPRRDRMLRQAQSWGAARLDTAITILTDTDLALRSAGQTAPQMALVERCLIRLAMLGASR